MTDKQRAALLRSLMADAHQTREGYVTAPGGPWWRKVDAKAARLLADLEFVIPQLGPLVKDGLSTMLMAPTHKTTGVDWTPKGDGLGVYIAFDDAFGDGDRRVLAVEALEVTKTSSAQGGLAFYATGASGIWYWYGHLDRTHFAGTKFRKGETVGLVMHGHGQPPGGPHAHLGLDVSPLGLPPLKYGRNGNGPPYTFGSPTIGAQLAKGLT